MFSCTSRKLKPCRKPTPLSSEELPATKRVSARASTKVFAAERLASFTPKANRASASRINTRLSIRAKSDTSSSATSISCKRERPTPCFFLSASARQARKKLPCSELKCSPSTNRLSLRSVPSRICDIPLSCVIS